MSEVLYKHICPSCSGKLESKGIRRERRRYRCASCKKSAGSVVLTDLEIESKRKLDKGIGNLSLAEREEELLGLNRPINLSKPNRKTKYAPYALLPQYDPIWQDSCQLEGWTNL